MNITLFILAGIATAHAVYIDEKVIAYTGIAMLTIYLIACYLRCENWRRTLDKIGGER